MKKHVVEVIESSFICSTTLLLVVFLVFIFTIIFKTSAFYECKILSGPSIECIEINKCNYEFQANITFIDTLNDTFYAPIGLYSKPIDISNSVIDQYTINSTWPCHIDFSDNTSYFAYIEFVELKERTVYICALIILIILTSVFSFYLLYIRRKSKKESSSNLSENVTSNNLSMMDVPIAIETPM